MSARPGMPYDRASEPTLASTWHAVSSGNVSDTFPGGAVCRLVPINTTQSSCTVVCEPTKGPNTHTLTARYSGDPADRFQHRPRQGMTVISS